MKYLTYKKADCLNGIGLRNVLWVPFCSHGCKGCFSKSTWRNGGTLVTEDFLWQLIEDLRPSYISGITLSGGDPMHKSNYSEIISLCRRIKRELPEKDIMVYTGYTYEELKNDLLRSPILSTIDTLLDGKYECDNPTTKPFRGSSNQILHKLVKGLSVEQS